MKTTVTLEIETKYGVSFRSRVVVERDEAREESPWLIGDAARGMERKAVDALRKKYPGDTFTTVTSTRPHA